MFKLAVIFIFHGLFIFSVLDIFFKSPVYSNLRPVEWNAIFSDLRRFSIEQGLPTYNKTSLDVVADRLVLFSCDGLPAHYLYEVSENNISNAPFIRSIVEEHGSWGLSFTRVPTESRPGHVAMIAGLYEDPSAIFWGWQDNPVTFDSVFNQSDTTFSWGCEDILHLFKKRTRPGHMVIYQYPSDWQDYSGKEGTAEKLDTWVKEQFDIFISEAKTNASLNTLLKKPKTIFFFHLLGMDVGGHAYKPKTSYYNNTMRNADKIIEDITTSINSFYGDDKTAFIFTSDHGMTDWGSHGASSHIETVTPIVFWGTGIKKPFGSNVNVEKQDVTQLNGKFGVSPPTWQLDHLFRHDINQADIAVLMAALLGIPIPVNSQGVLPLTVLDIPSEQVAVTYFANALQLLQQYHAKESDTQENLASILFQPFESLTFEEDSLKRKILSEIIDNDYKNAIYSTNKLIILALQGMEYYDSYFQNILLAHLLIGFFAIIMVTVGIILHFWSPRELIRARIFKNSVKLRMLLLTVLSTAGLVGFFSSLFADVFPIYYLLYFLLAINLLIWSVLENHYYFSTFKLLFNLSFFKHFIFYIFGIQIMVISFFERHYLSWGIFVLSLWPFIENSLNEIPKTDKYKWLFFCLLLAIFPSLPIVEKKENVVLRVIASSFWLYLSFKTKFSHTSESGKINFVLKCISCVTIVNIIGISLSFTYGISEVFFHQIISFFLLITLLITLKCGSNKIFPRFITLSISVGQSFLLFSLSYEAFFPVILAGVLFLWIKFEKEIHEHQQQQQHGYQLFRESGYLVHQDIRRCFFYIFFIFVSFFGIGNLSSINSFNIDWVKGFITEFLPFSMMVLIILRTILPIFLVTCAFKFVTLTVKVSTKPLFYLTLLFCEVVAAELLLSVQNVGSWLEIGTSLTRFIIMEFIVLFLLLFYVLVENVTKNVLETNQRLIMYSDNNIDNFPVDFTAPLVHVDDLEKDKKV